MMFKTDGDRKQCKEVIANITLILLKLDRKMVMIKKIITHQTQLLLHLLQPHLLVMVEMMYLQYQVLQLKMTNKPQLQQRTKEAHL
jgi:hypothetical protein